MENRYKKYIDNQKKLMGIKNTPIITESVNEIKEYYTKISLDDYKVKYNDIIMFIELTGDVKYHEELPDTEYGHGKHEIGGGFMIDDVDIDHFKLYNEDGVEIEDPSLVKLIYNKITHKIKNYELNDYISFDTPNNVNEDIKGLLSGLKNILNTSIVEPYKKGKSINSLDSLIAKGNTLFNDISKALNNHTETFKNIENIKDKINNSEEFSILDDATKLKYSNELEKLLVLRQSVVDIVNKEYTNLEDLKTDTNNDNQDQPNDDQEIDFTDIDNYINEAVKKQKFDSDHKIIFNTLSDNSSKIADIISNKYHNQIDRNLLNGLLNMTFDRVSNIPSSKFYSVLGKDVYAAYSNLTKDTGGISNIKPINSELLNKKAEENAIKFLNDKKYIVNDKNIKIVKDQILQKMLSKIGDIKQKLSSFDDVE